MNIKKLLPEKKLSRKRLLEFLDKKGFYVVLILCVAIVGAVAVLVTTHNISSSNTEFSDNLIPDEAKKTSDTDGGMITQSNVSSNTNAPNVQVPKVQPKGTEVSKPSIAPDTAKQLSPQKPTAKSIPTSAKASGTQGAANIKDQKFTMPVFGVVSVEYAQDKLVYSKTLEEWRAHSGLDLESERGSTVKAVADGVVAEVKNDPRLGIVVIVDHQNGIKTVYANLASEGTVNPNQRVKQGDIIGTIGNTASFETADNSHLHFEVLKGDQPVNPAGYLPVK